MGRKKGKDQILRRILEACAGGASKTQIVYNSNLNFHTVGPYLELLIRNGPAVMVEGCVPRYKTTAKSIETSRHSGSGRRLFQNTCRSFL